MTIVVRKPIFNPQGLVSFLEDAAASTNRAFENLLAPYRVTTEGNVKTVAVDLAGFTKDDIEVSVDEQNKTLQVIASVKKAEDEESPQGFYNRKVNLNFTMPEDSDYESVKSQYVDGVLKVTFSTKEPERVEPRKIEVG